MNTPHHMKRMLVGALLSAGFAVAGLGLATGTGQAQPAPMVCQDPSQGPSPTNSCTY
jgi:hypothetical protein